MEQNYYATVRNQYGRLIGDGYGNTVTEAQAEANKRTAETLRQANPAWKWRAVKRHVEVSSLPKK